MVTGGALGVDGFSALEVLPFANAASPASHTRGDGGDWLLDRSARSYGRRP
ncbi:hypothetical protein [Streptomyces capitiformicae]|uniref:Uncharacterized protein n=1 Tax=Streptomyces capitiformicae TaxID=2014920 RepID=A0A919GRX7_9ACTN|nr:hypothetical protein [Streptomyces capitiformicae]GHH89747.1 hypothetical protein GCM10017771_41780 [Streptomyces capitiformicae]